MTTNVVLKAVVMIPAPAIVNEVYQMHKASWSIEEKRFLHEKLNQHGIGDGITDWDQAISEVMSMIYVDGIRKGRETA